MEENNSITERKRKISNLLRSQKTIFFIILIALVAMGVYTRVLPMTSHNGNPGLWDIATNDWTLGPDLDPWSFVKNAKIIAQNGSLPATDTLRNVPLGVDNSRETILLPYMIFGTYKVVNLFGSFNMEFAGALFPVIMFGLTIIVFFLFSREIFVSKDKTKANIIATISTLFFIIMPSILPRTIAGIPEKESAGLLFMFLSFYLFLKAMKCKNIRNSVIIGIFAGVSTALMRFIWGGAVYIFGAIFIAMLLAFLFGKVNKRYYITYTSWMLSAFAIMVIFSAWFSVGSLFSLSYTSICIFLWIFLTLHFILWNTKLSNNKVLIYLEGKMPRAIASILISIVIIIPLSLIIFGPEFIYDKLRIIYELLFNPITGRWNTTVAENRPPYLEEWIRNFGPFLGKLPLMMALFLTGSVIFFKETFNKLMKKDSIKLTIAYIFLLFGMMFSRVSPLSIFNGNNIISRVLFTGSLLFFLFYLVYYSIKYTKMRKDSFSKIKFEYIFLISLFLLCLLTVRGAMRLIMVLASVVPIFVGYLIVKLIYLVRESERNKAVAIGVCALVILLTAFTGYTFYQTVTIQSYNFVPNYYNNQWQKAMSWTRDNTPTDSVFAHWWDYGYWIQAIGERATITDGGNVITYWNYLMGRHVLTGDTQEDALEFLYNHEANYLLIDSSDINKYGAYSSIGSDESYDRFSVIPTAIMDPQKTSEDKNSITLFYNLQIGIDEDIYYEENGTEYFFPYGQSVIYGILVTKSNNSIDKVDALILNKGVLKPIPIKYAQDENGYYIFRDGISATVKIIKRVDGTGSMHPEGALLYVSPRVTKTLFSHLYILDDPTNKFPNFNISHIEPNLFTQQNEIFYYDPVGIVGPIKIWNITYSGDEEIKEEYLDTDSTKYLDWKL